MIARVDTRRKALAIRLVLTDCDGVLTDAGTYYSPWGETLKRFSVRAGMGVQRLREQAGIETGIITGERSSIVRRRARKLGMTEVHLGVQDKLRVAQEIGVRLGLA